ncbi:hypothetical protein [Prosthecobacter sp.]|uniref:hypothetical protein n=1 Tax=Prosthecobacter sp. TaxID=1965333 RepID=UPI0037844BAB
MNLLYDPDHRGADAPKTECMRPTRSRACTRAARWMRNGLAAGASLLLSACAGLSGGSLTEDQDWRANGFRYYDSSPYLLVYTDNKGGLNSELKYMPDLTKKRQVKPYQFLASVDGTLTFEDGILTGAESNGDGTAVPKAVISALEKTAKAAIAADMGTAREAMDADGLAPRVYLFKIIKTIDDKGNYVWELKGSSGSPVKS